MWVNFASIKVMGSNLATKKLIGAKRKLSVMIIPRVFMAGLEIF